MVKMKKRIILAFAIVLAVILTAGIVIAATIPITPDSTHNEIKVLIDSKEIAADGTWSYNGSFELRPGYFPDGKYQRISFWVGNEEKADFDAGWYSDSNPVDELFNFGTNQIGYKYAIVDRTNATIENSGPQKVERYVTGGNKFTGVEQFSFHNISLGIQAGAYAYDTSDFVKIWNIKIRGLKGDTAPDTGLEGGETIIVEIPKSEVVNGSWTSKSTYELKPGLYPDKKLQRVAFLYDKKWVAEIGACYWNDSWYSTNPVDELFNWGTNEIGYCYWMEDFTIGGDTGKIKKSRYVVTGQLQTATSYEKIENSNTPNISALLQAEAAATNANDTIRLKEVTITGLMPASCPVVRIPGVPAPPGCVEPAPKSDSILQALGNLNKKLYSNLGLE